MFVIKDDTHGNGGYTVVQAYQRERADRYSEAAGGQEYQIPVRQYLHR